MRDFEEIYQGIKERFHEQSGHHITENSVMDMYTVSIADVYDLVYEDIEDMRNPHLYSKLREQSLDDLGFFMNMPRYTNEADGQYLYRLMNWRYTAESSNMTAINNALLRVQKSSSAEYLPQTNGSGTGSVYIIPKEYTDENIAESIAEAVLITEGIASPSVYIEYIVPDPVPVIIHAGIQGKTGADLETIKRDITLAVQDYVNSTKPKGYVSVGEINRIGINTEMVEFYTTLQIFIDGEEQDEVNILQPIDKKFLLDEIIWSEE